MYHKEGNDNNVNDIICGNDWPEIVNGSIVFLIAVYRDIKQAGPPFKRRNRE